MIMFYRNFQFIGIFKKNYFILYLYEFYKIGFFFFKDKEIKMFLG